MSYLIDTDLLSFLRRKGRSRKLERFVAAREAEIFVSVVTWAEIEHGITLTEEAFQNDLLQWVASKPSSSLSGNGSSRSSRWPTRTEPEHHNPLPSI